jgi:ATP-dependent RNA helicase DDX60
MNLPPGGTFKSLDTYATTNRSRFLHPISLLHVGARTLPEDLSLEAADLLSLYRSLSVHEELADFLTPLEPTKYLPRDRLLTQLDMIKFENALKELIISSVMIKPSLMETVTKALEDPLLTQASNSQPISTKKHVSGPINAVEVFKQNIPFLVADLHAQGDLVRHIHEFGSIKGLSVIISPLSFSTLTVITAKSLPRIL